MESYKPQRVCFVYGKRLKRLKRFKVVGITPRIAFYSIELDKITPSASFHNDESFGIIANSVSGWVEQRFFLFSASYRSGGVKSSGSPSVEGYSERRGIVRIRNDRFIASPCYENARGERLLFSLGAYCLHF